MTRLLLAIAVAVVVALTSRMPTAPVVAAARAEPHRSPIDLAVLPDARLALVANHTADSAALVDLEEGKLLSEAACGKKPAGVAVSRDGKRAAVSNLWGDSLTLLQIEGQTLRPLATVPVGHQPRGLVFAPDGASLYVALAGAHEVVQFNWATRAITRRWSAPIEPRRVALTRDGKRLVAIANRSAQIHCWDTASGKLEWSRLLADDFNLLGLTLSPDDRDIVTTQIHHRYHLIAKHNIEAGWAVDNRLGRFALTPGRETGYWQLALDLRGKAVGDPSAAAFSAKGDWLVIAAAGTQELILFQKNALVWNSGEPGDFLDSSLDLNDGKLRRLSVGGRPLAVHFLGDSDRAAVANYLLDAVQVVDVRAGKILRTIALGGPSEPSLVRRGEAIFYDAKRSHHQWFSCHSCHTDGHTNGRLFDTLNDESNGNPKLTPTLRGVARTAPYTWHGWQNQLGDAVAKSITETLYGAKPTDADVKAVVAFLATLDHPPNPHRRADGSLSAGAERGQALFVGKARCARCHQGDQYTSPKNYDVKLEPDSSPFDLWNPPSLRGVYDRGPYLHDGRAETLDDVLRIFHAPEKLGGAALSGDERRDLIEFLKSL